MMIPLFWSSRCQLLLVSSFLTWCVRTSCADPLAAPLVPLEMMQKAQQAIASYPHNQPAQAPKLRVVYFTPADAEPQAEHQARLTRILLDINHFLRDEMRRNGLRSEGLALEMEGDLVKLHEVEGQHAAEHYRHESGGETEAEMRAALKGKIDFDQEFVLALYSMCRKHEDGSYFFYAPYYGKSGSNQVWGLCHAADCELLDVTFLTEKQRRIRYEEHYGKFDKTLADFNSAYIGGIAHELCHGLGLPHDCHTPAELATLGTALMANGNLTYGREKWRAGTAQGSFLTVASSLRLAAHPLITGGASDRLHAPKAEWLDLQFTSEPKALQIHGKLKTDVPCYAVIAYIDPAARPSDYDAVPYCGLVTDQGFHVDTIIPAPGAYTLRLTALHLNGAVTMKQFHFTAPAKDLLVDAEKLNHYSEADSPLAVAQFINPAAQARVASQLLAEETNPEERAKLMRLTEQLKSKDTSPKDLLTVTESPQWLSDAAWTTASVGWGVPARNQMGGMAEVTGPFIKLGSAYQEKGLYAHSPSRYTFKLGKKWTSLTAFVGIKSGDARQRNARFIIKGDGKELYRSALLNSDKTEAIDIKVAEVEILDLIVEPGTGPNGHAWAVWGSPRLSR